MSVGSRLTHTAKGKRNFFINTKEELKVVRVRYTFFYILPLIVLVLVPAFGIWFDPFPALPIGLWRWLGAFFIIGGLAIGVTAHRFIYRSEQWAGTVSALPGEPNELIVRGPYRFVRHPIMVGLTLVLIGESLMFQSAMPFLWWLVMALPGIPFIIFVEERRLERKFGDAYRRYRAMVPAFIPRLHHR